MRPQVEASTSSAGSLFAGSRFEVPDFQREYSWEVRAQVSDFWDDLSGAVDESNYFLGLVILNEGGARLEVVDGQQRLVTLSLMTNALRLLALRLGRRLVAESIRKDFLFATDLRTEQEEARLLLTDLDDRRAFEKLLAASSDQDVEPSSAGPIAAAHHFLFSRLDADLQRSGRAAFRLGEWAEFVSSRLEFAVFRHPDRSAAFRVYEVVNTRGKDLTPSELIKSHVIGNSTTDTRAENYQRWTSIENQLEEIGALHQLTTFVRHVVTLRQGFVVPKELYRSVTNLFEGAEGVSKFLGDLEANLPIYLRLLEPSGDVELPDDLGAFYEVVKKLGATRIRPLLLVAGRSGAPIDLTRRILEVALPGILYGSMNTGSAEAQIARAARRLFAGGDWSEELARLSSLVPTREELRLRFERPMNRSQALIVRSVAAQNAAVPALLGSAHQLRPRDGVDWDNFSDREFRDRGTQVGNWILLNLERRPFATRTPESVVDRFPPVLVPGEHMNSGAIASWSVRDVEQESRRVAEQVLDAWYGNRSR